MDINERGEIVGFSYHDGLLTSIDVSENGSATLGISPEGGHATRLRLSGLRALRVSDFWEGNIINFMWWLSWEQADHWPASTIGLTHFGPDRPPGTGVFRLESSYGASIVAVCERPHLVP